MASVFRQMLVMVKNVEALSTSKTGQHPKVPGSIHYSSEKVQPFLSNKLSKSMSFQPMLFPMQAFTKHIKPRYIRNWKVSCRKFPVLQGDLGVCIYVCAVSLETSRPAAAFKLLMRTIYDFHSLIPKLSLQLCHCITTLCCAAKGLSFKLRFLLAMLAVAHPP